ncbi:hypothetical protein B4N89_45805 [Embleya scabrispora]|uniref:Uncharacterized protein n=1 Tax=Embleya scabrispora TaxID=159449 RepID=A0A1T3NIZ2_9ACTN|nr:hypothetical protein B4N89_45805 [Embleya scabrispora]
MGLKSERSPTPRGIVLFLRRGQVTDDDEEIALHHTRAGRRVRMPAGPAFRVADPDAIGR